MTTDTSPFNMFDERSLVMFGDQSYLESNPPSWLSANS